MMTIQQSLLPPISSSPSPSPSLNEEKIEELSVNAAPYVPKVTVSCETDSTNLCGCPGGKGSDANSALNTDDSDFSTVPDISGLLVSLPAAFPYVSFLDSIADAPQSPENLEIALQEFDRLLKEEEAKLALDNLTDFSISILPTTPATEKILLITKLLANSKYDFAFKESFSISTSGATWALVSLFKKLQERLEYFGDSKKSKSLNEIINHHRYVEVLLEMSHDVMFTLYRKTQIPSYLLWAIKLNFERIHPAELLDPIALVGDALIEGGDDVSPTILMIVGKILMHCSDLEKLEKLEKLDKDKGEEYCRNALYRSYSGGPLASLGNESVTLKELFLSLSFDFDTIPLY